MTGGTDNVKQAFGFWTCVVLYVNVMDGPGFLAIPSIYRSAGWIVPTVGFLVLAAVACLAGFCIVDVYEVYTTKSHRGCEDEDEKDEDEEDDDDNTCETTRLKASPRERVGSQEVLPEGEDGAMSDGGTGVEFCELFQPYFGKHSEKLIQLMFHLCLYSLILAQIIIGAQVMDAFVIFMFGGTCAIELPTFGWTCTSVIALQPFGAGNNIVSIGFIVCMVACIWLSSLDMHDNLTPQFISAGLLCFAACTFFWHFASHTYDPLVPSRLAGVANDLGGVLGVVIFNYSFITAVPCVLSAAAAGVPMKRAIIVSVGVMCFLYITMGILGAMAFDHPDGDVMASLLKPEAPVITKLAVFGFTHAIVPCIPVYCLLLQSSLMRTLGVSNRMAYAMSSLFPWTLALLFYNGDGFFDTLVRWASLLVNGAVNLVLPLLLYLHCKANTAATASPKVERGNLTCLQKWCQWCASSTSKRQHQISLIGAIFVTILIVLNIVISLYDVIVLHTDPTAGTSD